MTSVVLILMMLRNVLNNHEQNMLTLRQFIKLH
jgi:hypothetical protein